MLLLMRDSIQEINRQRYNQMPNEKRDDEPEETDLVFYRQYPLKGVGDDIWAVFSTAVLRNRAKILPSFYSATLKDVSSMTQSIR